MIGETSTMRVIYNHFYFRAANAYCVACVFHLGWHFFDCGEGVENEHERCTTRSQGRANELAGSIV